jgi:TPR repeat protein
MGLSATPLKGAVLWVALAFAAATNAAAEGPTAGAGSEAQRAYDAGDYGKARQLWTPQAESGDVQAQLSLATMDDLGQGAPRDAASAYRWYRKAAETGNAGAEFNVAVMNDAGDGTQHDTAAATLWYARSAAHGNHRAQYNLGQLYAAGDGVPRNVDVAEAYFRAASVELPAALGKLVALQRSGQAVQPAEAEAGATPRPAQPSAPLDGTTVQAAAGLSGTPIELVWIAGEQVPAVRFFVQVLALDEMGPHEVFASTVDDTSLLAPVQRVPGRYAWRVYSIGSNLKHYAASDWERFDVEAPK